VLTQYLQQFIPLIQGEWSPARVLVVGDIMLDKYVWGQVVRISPEAPVPIVRVEHRTETPGGAANVAMNLAGLGVSAMVAGFCGDDEDGRQLEQLLKQARVEHCLVRTAIAPTVSKTRLMSGHQQLLRLDVERKIDATDAAHAELLAAALNLAARADAIILSDYAKGTLTAALCRLLIQAGRKRRIPVLVDPKGQDFLRYQGATTICPNLQELALALNRPPEDIQALFAEAQSCLASWGVDYLTVTMGDPGIAVLRPESIAHAPARARQVFDVSGAGDTVVATLAAGLASRVPIEEAVKLANLAAGVVVGKVGTVAIQGHELMAELASGGAPPEEGKILDRGQLLTRLAAWRANGDAVVLTNGCFDLLHFGHVTLLEAARREGRRLVVAINSDASVRRLKGAGRPLMGQGERARMLAALTAVDAVVVFEEDTPLECILSTRPDVLVKGGDYAESQVVGEREIATWNGRVKIVPLVPGCSTSNLVEHIAASPCYAEENTPSPAEEEVLL
jgi:D-beta-D-heptose 7-phosphate kinase/D-beta-D-heptose 1-phosphate adenosyltransferase